MSDLSSKLEPGAQSNIELSKAISLKRIADAMENRNPYLASDADYVARLRAMTDEQREVYLEGLFPTRDLPAAAEHPFREVVNGVETMESVRKRTEARIAAEVAEPAADEWHVKERPGLLDVIQVDFAGITNTGYAYEFAASWSSVSRWRLIEAAP